jgi:membrane protein
MNAFNRLTVRLKDGISRLDARLHQKFSYRLIKRTFREFSKDEVTDRSAAVAYYVVLSLFPLLIGLISLLGFFLPIGTVEETVSKALEQALPASTSLIEDNLNNIVQFRGPGAIISVVLLLWSGSNLFAAVGRSVNRAWDIKKDRPFIKKKALHVGMVLATGLLLLLSFGITTAVNLIEEFDGLAIFWLIEIGGYIMGFALVFLVLLLIYKFIPNRKTTWGMTCPAHYFPLCFSNSPNRASSGTWLISQTITVCMALLPRSLFSFSGSIYISGDRIAWRGIQCRAA